MGKKKFEDFKVTVGGSREKRRVAGTVAIVGVETAFEEILDDFRVTGRDGSGKRVVTTAIGGNCVDVGTFTPEVAGGVEMAEETGESEDRETVGGRGIGNGGIGFDELLNAGKIAGGRSFGEIHLEPARQEKFANFVTPGIDRKQKSGGAGLVLGRGESWIGIEKRADCGEIPGADGIEEELGVGHGGSF
jgi:hypothetical protein